MDEIIEIDPIGMKKLDNGQHVHFHSRAYDLVNEYEPAKIGLPEPLKTEWKGNIDTEEYIGKEVVAETLTKTMNKKNEERDRILTYIFRLIRACVFSPEEAEEKAASELALVINSYGRVQRESFDRQSSHIDGLLVDLKKTENAAHVTTLRLTSALAKLEAANGECKKLYLQSVKNPHRSNLPTAAEVRPKTDAIYNRVVFMLKAAYVSGVASVDKAALKQLAEHLNSLVDRTDKAYHQSLAQKKSAADKKKKKPDTPPQPKEPKPKKPKEGDKPDIHLPEPEAPKKPEGGGEGKKPDTGSGGDGGTSGGGSSPEITLPEE